MRSPRGSTTLTRTPRMTPMTTGSETATFRPATASDAEALAALAHVFPDVPYPTDEVRERWLRLIADPDVSVEVVGAAGRLDVYLAWDEERLRHLGVRP